MNLYKGTEIIDTETINKWKQEIISYNSGTGVPSKDNKYLFQDIEIDAIAFAHKMMLSIFKSKQ